MKSNNNQFQFTCMIHNNQFQHQLSHVLSTANNTHAIQQRREAKFTFSESNIDTHEFSGNTKHASLHYNIENKSAPTNGTRNVWYSINLITNLQ